MHQLARAPGPHSSPGVHVRTLRPQSFAQGLRARVWLAWASRKVLCLSGVSRCGIRVRAAHSFDPADGPSGSALGLRVSEGMAVHRQDSSGGRAGEGGWEQLGQASACGPVLRSLGAWRGPWAGGATGRGPRGGWEATPGIPRASLCVCSTCPRGCGACVCASPCVRAAGDRPAAAPRSCWLRGSCGSAPGGRADGCGRRPCWGSCGCCVWGPRWRAPWPSTASQSSCSRCGEGVGGPRGGSGRGVRRLLR